MSINVSVHAEGFVAQSDPTRTNVWIDVQAGGTNKAGIFLTPELCDRLGAAVTEARQLLAEGDAS